MPAGPEPRGGARGADQRLAGRRRGGGGGLRARDSGAFGCRGQAAGERGFPASAGGGAEGAPGGSESSPVFLALPPRPREAFIAPADGGLRGHLCPRTPSFHLFP